MAAHPDARPVYIESGRERCFALVQGPLPGPSRAPVLLCPPFGWDDICSYRSRRDWADQLALEGHPSLRIDLPGTADSERGSQDAARVDAWTRAIADASRWLGLACDTAEVVVLGIGLGGLLAARAALEGAPVDQLILWSVPSRGRTLVRELRAFSRVEVANASEPDGDPGQAPPEHRESTLAEPQELTVNGYTMSAETVATLERLDLSDIPVTSWQTRRVLVLQRERIKPDARLVSLLQKRARVSVMEGIGYAAMMQEPQEALPPRELFGSVGAWLGEDSSAPARAAETATAGAEGGQPVGRSAGGQPATSDRMREATGAAQVLELTDGDGGADPGAVRRSPAGGLRERPLHFERPGGSSGEPCGRLFGVLSESRAQQAELCAVLLNAGPQRHTGPNRMWVEMARRWATLGVPTLRVDLAGIGDSDGDARAFARVGTFYRSEYVEQVRAVLDELARLGAPERFLLLGLCAGAYWSLHTALEDERVASVVMLNPRTLIWDEWAYTLRRTHELRKRLLRVSTWKRAVRGELTLARHAETARAIARRAIGTPGRARHARGASDGAGAGAPGDTASAVESLFDGLRERGQDGLLVLTGKEPLRAVLERAGTFSRPDRWPNLELVLTGSAQDTHTLTPPWLQREVHGLVDGALSHALERTPARSPAAGGAAARRTAARAASLSETGR